MNPTAWHRFSVSLLGIDLRECRTFCCRQFGVVQSLSWRMWSDTEDYALNIRFESISIVVALLFGLFHIVVSGHLLQERMIPGTLMGIILGTLLVERSGSVIPRAAAARHAKWVAAVRCALSASPATFGNWTSAKEPLANDLDDFQPRPGECCRGVAFPDSPGSLTAALQFRGGRL